MERGSIVRKRLSSGTAIGPYLFVQVGGHVMCEVTNGPLPAKPLMTQRIRVSCLEKQKVTCLRLKEEDIERLLHNRPIYNLMSPQIDAVFKTDIGKILFAYNVKRKVYFLNPTIMKVVMRVNTRVGMKLLPGYRLETDGILWQNLGNSYR